MARQILTFVVVFIGLFLLMRSCTKSDEGSKAVISEEAPARTEDAITLSSGDLSVRLASDGSILSIYDGANAIVRPVSTGRLPLRFLLNRTSGAMHALTKGEWTSKPVDGGHEFVYDEEGFTVRKTVRVVEDGLDVALQVGEGDETIRGYIVTALSGVTLGKPSEETRTLATWLLGSGARRTFSYEDLVERRKNRRSRPSEPAVRETIAEGATVEAFGVVGRDYYVRLESAPKLTERLNLDAFTIDRADGKTNEIEGYLDIPALENGYEGVLRLRWTPRDELPEDLRKLVEVGRAETLTLEDDAFKVVLTSRGAAIRAVWCKSYSTVAGEPPTPETWVPIILPGTRAGERSLTLSMIGDRYGADLARVDWGTGTIEGRTASYRYESPTKWTFTKRITLPDEGRFDLGVEITIVAPPDVAASDVKYQLVGPSNGYLADADKFTTPGAFLDERSGGDDDDVDYADLVDGEELRRTYGEGDRGLARAVCVRGKYFLTALVTPEEKDDEGRAVGVVTQAVCRAVELTEPYTDGQGEKREHGLQGSFSCRVPVYGGEATQGFRLYCGPTATEALEVLELEDAIDFGFFGAIGRFLMWLMKVLYAGFGSYGAAIIAMTLIVRAVLLPISYKTQLNMQQYQKRMSKVKPLLDKIQKEHAKDPTKMNAERMRIMREHKVGLPLGCLMVFFQIPIWFALFQALRVEFALRHASFLWAVDLSAPDHLTTLPFWPHWLNLLPLLMLVLWYTQQRLAPTTQSDDPQMKMQMKMMRMMPFVFFFFLYSYAAALAVYMCVSSAWGIAESKLVRKAIAKQADAPA